jgi:hypothetical protein
MTTPTATKAVVAIFISLALAGKVMASAPFTDHLDSDRDPRNRKQACKPI